MISAANRLILTVVLMAGLASTAQSGELHPPTLGSRMVWKCQGPFTSHYELNVVSITDNVVRYEGRVDDGDYYAEKHASLTGTSLWYRLFGDRRQWFDFEDFADYRLMRPGSRFKGAVPAQHDEERWVWKYEISIGQQRSLTHPILGKVDVVPVFEQRSVFHGTYWSKMTTLLAPVRGISVSWSYEDENGVERCDIAEYNEKNGVSSVTAIHVFLTGFEGIDETGPGLSVARALRAGYDDAVQCTALVTDTGVPAAWMSGFVDRILLLDDWYRAPSSVIGKLTREAERLRCKIILIPGSTCDAPMFADFRSDLENAGVALFIPPVDKLRQLSNPTEWESVLAAVDIDLPSASSFLNADEACRAAPLLAYPVVAAVGPHRKTVHDVSHFKSLITDD